MKKYLILGIILISLKVFGQNNTSSDKLKFFIGEQVINAGDENEKQIIQIWKNYISSGQYGNPDSPYWSFEKTNVPDEYLWALNLTNIQNNKYQTQCKIIGIFPVEHGYYCLKSAFMHIVEGEIFLDVIPTVYAKKFNGKFLLVNSTTYHKEILEHHKIGNVNFYVHPFHKFDIVKAKQMSAFCEEMAKKFGTSPFEIDYFVSNTSREITEIWGYEYMDRMYRPEQTGGVALVSQNLVLAGNNSEYYPHEVVHLYAYNVAHNLPYFWINEGIATYFAGSSEKTFEWHLKELKEFHKTNPNYDYVNIDKLVDFDIPNGKHMTDLRYIIGALIIREIYKKEGMKGIKEALTIGDTKDDMFVLIKKKLNVDKKQFNTFIQKQIEN
ncbi:hypothetical protein AD998_09820 [bacterium 336/3]|nr:hypothetical protein AD998_09820 [bacterium 336/3]